MDAKALAKSKRSHSQQLSKKHHPNPKSKTQSGSGSIAQSSSGNTKESSGKKVRDKAIRGLPSNWDRYDEGNDSRIEDSSSGGGVNQETPDSVLPKSKGADYSHLIAEAQSQSESTICLDSFPSFDDILPGTFLKFNYFYPFQYFVTFYASDEYIYGIINILALCLFIVIG